MLGAIIGDMVGSIYEFANTKRTDFPFFSERSSYTDDSIMTLAVAEWLLTDSQHTHESLERIMVKYADEYPYPMGGYGGGFSRWLFAPEGLIKLSLYKSSLTGGGYYSTQVGDVNLTHVWLCPVTLFVLGRYPQYIYFKRIDNKK